MKTPVKYTQSKFERLFRPIFSIKTLVINVLDFWCHVSRDKLSKYPKFCFVTPFLAIPASSASNERVFQLVQRYDVPLSP